MYVSDQFVEGQLQLTNYRDPSTKLGFWMGTRLEQQTRKPSCRWQTTRRLRKVCTVYVRVVGL